MKTKVLVAACICVLFLSGTAAAVDFVRGDANSDGSMSISDAAFILNYLFVGAAEPECLESADVNDDWSVDIADAVTNL